MISYLVAGLLFFTALPALHRLSVQQHLQPPINQISVDYHCHKSFANLSLTTYTK